MSLLGLLVLWVLFAGGFVGLVAALVGVGAGVVDVVGVVSVFYCWFGWSGRCRCRCLGWCCCCFCCCWCRCWPPEARPEGSPRAKWWNNCVSGGGGLREPCVLRRFPSISVIPERPPKGKRAEQKRKRRWRLVSRNQNTVFYNVFAPSDGQNLVFV